MLNNFILLGNWLQGQEIALAEKENLENFLRSPLPIHDELTQVNQELERKKKECNANALEKKVPSSNDNNSFTTVAHYETWQHFITYCQKREQTTPTSSVCLVLLEYLATNTSVDSLEKIGRLFGYCFERERQSTLASYVKYEETWSTQPGITKIIVESKVAEFELQLAREKNIGTIFSLAFEKLGDFCDFVALLLYFLRKGVSSQEILRQDILQAFLSFHVADLFLPQNSIKKLYALLGSFEEALPLISQAQKTFITIAASSYSLVGEQKTERIGTQEYKVTLIQPLFTCDDENLENLYQIFGNTVLITALRQFKICPNKTLKLFLIRCFTSKSGEYPEKLSAFINNLAKSHPALLAPLTQIIDETNLVETLHLNHSLALFHLACHNFSILEKFENEETLKKYIQSIRNQDSFELLSQLFQLFKGFKQYADNPIAEKIIFRTLFNVLIESPHIVDLDALKFLTNDAFFYQDIFQQIDQELFDELKKDIKEKLQNITANCSDFIINVNDFWKKKNYSFSVISEHCRHLNYQFPRDVYELNAVIVRQIIEDNKDNENNQTVLLENFLQAIILTSPSTDDSNISEEAKEKIIVNERALISILAMVDNSKVYDICMRLLVLAKSYSSEQCQQWLEKKYDDSTVLEVAAKAGNKDKLVSPYVQKHPHLQRTAFLKATQYQQLDIIQKLLEKYPILKEETVTLKNRFIKEKNDYVVVKYLCSLTDYFDVDQEVLLALLEFSAKNGLYDDVVNFFSQCKQKFPETLQIAREKILLSAAEGGRLRIVKFILPAVPKVYNHDLDKLLGKAILKASFKENLPIIKYLFTYFSHPFYFAPHPSKTAIFKIIVESTLNVAIELNSIGIINYCHTLFTLENFNNENIQEAFFNAARRGHIESIAYLDSIFKKPTEAKNVLEVILKGAIETGKPEVISYCCVKFESYLPDVSKLRDLAIEATKKGHLLIVKNLLNRIITNTSGNIPNDIHRILECACIYDKLSIVEYFCTQKTDFLTEECVKNALHGAILQKNLPIVEYLFSLESSFLTGGLFKEVLETCSIFLESFEVIFAQAVKENKVELVKSLISILLSSSLKNKSSVLEKLLAYTSMHVNKEIVQAICSSIPDLTTSENIYYLEKGAILGDKIDTLLYLLSLNNVSSDLQELGTMIATNGKEKLLRGLLDQHKKALLSEDIFVSMLVSAISNNQKDFIALLYELSLKEEEKVKFTRENSAFKFFYIFNKLKEHVEKIKANSSQNVTLQDIAEMAKYICKLPPVRSKFILLFINLIPDKTIQKSFLSDPDISSKLSPLEKAELLQNLASQGEEVLDLLTPEIFVAAYREQCCSEIFVNPFSFMKQRISEATTTDPTKRKELTIQEIKEHAINNKDSRTAKVYKNFNPTLSSGRVP